MRGTAQDYLSNNNRVPHFDKEPKGEHMNKKNIIITSSVILGIFLLYNISKSFSEQGMQLITVQADETFAIQFDADLTSELQWTLTSIENPENIQAISEDFIPAEESETSGIRLFTFKALRRGSSYLKFDLHTEDQRQPSVKSELYKIEIKKLIKSHSR